MLRKEKECSKKWEKFTYSKNEGEKYHKSVAFSNRKEIKKGKMITGLHPPF